MHYFEYKDGELHAEGVSLSRLAREVGTPFYAYSHRTLVRHFRVFDEAFASVPHLVCFAMKSNSNLAILRLFAGMGGGLDIVSGGELFRGLKAGAPADRVVFAGVGKSDEELAYALEQGVLMFNVESEEELANIEAVAARMGKRARVAIRVNPDVDPATHPYISTGMKKSKFGIDITKARAQYRAAAGMPHLEPCGVHCHIGSQITQSSPFVEAVEKVASLVRALRADGHDIRYLNLGGGLGITYRDEAPPLPSDYAGAILPAVKNLGCTLIFEPGRVIVGNAGVLVTKVLYAKSKEEKRFVIIDAGMNDLIRPALYESYQEALPVEEAAARRPRHKSDLVGPVCESGDYLAKDRQLPEYRRGDLIAIMSAGAYGFAMSSNYNSRPRPPEILVRGEEYHIIRRRESYDDLILGESIPSFIAGGGE
ncbi:MAG: diaminopimelate decarboxylase [Candidatus Tectomicrobia bacterium]|uniref:Diaminopimelate decarboxylase n=1 Tax=Tectimicrobiota bacterium TaxID=2528274 RepID=A0A932HZI1_UNCTE|nr:diaminopimelate decarboxylase [Candidatus Tectomicrobia bacterium]